MSNETKQAEKATINAVVDVLGGLQAENALNMFSGIVLDQMRDKGAAVAAQVVNEADKAVDVVVNKAKDIAIDCALDVGSAVVSHVADTALDCAADVALDCVGSAISCVG